MGGENVLLIPRRRQPLPDYGVLARRGHDDPPHEEGHVVGRVHAGIDQLKVIPCLFWVLVAF